MIRRDTNASFRCEEIKRDIPATEIRGDVGTLWYFSSHYRKKPLQILVNVEYDSIKRVNRDLTDIKRGGRLSSKTYSLLVKTQKASVHSF